VRHLVTMTGLVGDNQQRPVERRTTQKERSGDFK
jgi:hypothetical protein